MAPTWLLSPGRPTPAEYRGRCLSATTRPRATRAWPDGAALAYGGGGYGSLRDCGVGGLHTVCCVARAVDGAQRWQRAGPIARRWLGLSCAGGAGWRSGGQCLGTPSPSAVERRHSLTRLWLSCRTMAPGVGGAVAGVQGRHWWHRDTTVHGFFAFGCMLVCRRAVPAARQRRHAIAQVVESQCGDHIRHDTPHAGSRSRLDAVDRSWSHGAPQA